MAITATQARKQGVTPIQLQNCWSWHWDKAMMFSSHKDIDQREHHLKVMAGLEQTIIELKGN